ncbi:nicotinate-nucleotide--dimethylbenzimidazole phosphoribosyltransferase [Aquimarina sp. TRL1]|uniref:nicotinate-nucleotide--dimethylbenzimidazole phosphoribosyltransferase n=1 Tax=Aquimarina sp. (strain TRL1) TaxID=2736252 RepID=UPI00158F1A66|nr:nicotinate-nucleotide--dimethylbenzimidazole phosphoribosyltransferase [Aquimarina sp. TRL1]QKX06280.1 nicotinate-nucleotide--dimethylbenzimidazole phosphoribosyltransferase [Aquimarina sp. TRL1]
MNFNITSISNDELEGKLKHKIDNKTKPKGALGTLECIAKQIGLIQNTLEPSIQNPTMIVFAGDHGIAAKGEVNPFPQEVTSQMVFNFLQGGAAINTFCNLNTMNLSIVDAGVNFDFKDVEGLIDAKIDFGTKNYQEQPAMTPQQLHAAIERGSTIVKEHQSNDCNTIAFGEMGIGNTSAASLLMAYYTGIPIEDCIGAGTGLQEAAILNKINILSKVYNSYSPKSAMEALATFGGFEIAMITGAILEAAQLKMTIIIDGFIVTAALLAAQAIHSKVIDYCIFAHNSGEQGHQKMLRFLDKVPLLNLGLRLGEGTGAAIALPIIQSAVSFLNQMASFEDAAVSDEVVKR